MKKNSIYASVIDEACRISAETNGNSDSVNRIEAKKQELLKKFEENTFIKVLFVGDFNAGKSSLLNAMIGNDLLPVDVVPTTAVSYELYYSTDEHLEIHYKDKPKATTCPLSQISSLDVGPGDVVYVFVDNEFVKTMNEKGIVLVDMPGIDSGIKEHNDAIFNYFSEGSFFFLVTAAEQGTLRRSSIRFVDELKKYELPCNIIISKSDQKPETDLKDIKAEIEDQAKRMIRDDIEVSVASAAEKRLEEVQRMLCKLDAEAVFANKFSQKVKDFVSEIIGELELQIKLALSNKKDFDAKIKALEAEREKAQNNLNEKDRSAQSVADSAEDILNDVREAIIEKSSVMATSIYNNKNDKNAFSNELLSVIRPVLFHSFKREISDYQDAIGESIREFSLNIDGILNDNDNTVLGIVKNIPGKDTLVELARRGLDTLITKYPILIVLKPLSLAIRPIIDILINLIPSFLESMFKKKKTEAIRQKIESSVTEITDALREPVTKELIEKRRAAMTEMERMIDGEIEKINNNIRFMQTERQVSEIEITAKVQTLRNGIDRLNSLIERI